MTAKIRPIGHVPPRALPPPRPLPLPASEKALRAATRAGYDDGERIGYVSGWRYGVLCGLLVGLPIGMVSIWALIELGRMTSGT